MHFLSRLSHVISKQQSHHFLQDEALTNKEESILALQYLARLLVIPIISGFLVSHAVAAPVLEFTRSKNPDAFAMTDRQKVESAQTVHIEEARIKMDVAIGRLPPMEKVRG